MRHCAFIIGCVAVASLCWYVTLYARREMLVSRVFERTAYSNRDGWHDTDEGFRRDAALHDWFYSVTYTQQRYSNGSIGPVGGTLRIYPHSGIISVSFVILSAMVVGVYLFVRAVRER